MENFKIPAEQNVKQEKKPPEKIETEKTDLTKAKTEDINEEQKKNDRKKTEMSEKKEIEAIRKSIGISENKDNKKNGWRAILRPRENWREERKIDTDHPLDRLKRLVKSFSKSEREKNKINENNIASLKRDRNKFPEYEMDYKHGTGVEGMVGGKVGILAKGFFECSSLVFQTPDRVSVLHISPNTIIDTSGGGEIVQNRDIYGHIRSALKGLIAEHDTVEKTAGGNINLSQEEIKKLQKMIDSGELQTTMLAGEDKVVPVVPMELASGASNNNLPSIKTESHYFGGTGGEGGYAVYATPENIYFIGSNNRIMKKGVDFPSTMFDYKEI